MTQRLSVAVVVPMIFVALLVINPRVRCDPPADGPNATSTPPASTTRFPPDLQVSDRESLPLFMRLTRRPYFDELPEFVEGILNHELDTLRSERERIDVWQTKLMGGHVDEILKDRKITRDAYMESLHDVLGNHFLLVDIRDVREWANDFNYLMIFHFDEYDAALVFDSIDHGWMMTELLESPPDVNLNERADVVLIDRSSRTGERLHVIEWDGEAFVDIVDGTLEVPNPTYAIRTGQIIVAGDHYTDDAALAQAITEIWQWNGAVFTRTKRISGPPLTADTVAPIPGATGSVDMLALPTPTPVVPPPPPFEEYPVFIADYLSGADLPSDFALESRLDRLRLILYEWAENESAWGKVERLRSHDDLVLVNVQPWREGERIRIGDRLMIFHLEEGKAEMVLDSDEMPRQGYRWVFRDEDDNLRGLTRGLAAMDRFCSHGPCYDQLHVFAWDGETIVDLIDGELEMPDPQFVVDMNQITAVSGYDIAPAELLEEVPYTEIWQWDDGFFRKTNEIRAPSPSDSGFSP